MSSIEWFSDILGEWKKSSDSHSKKVVLENIKDEYFIERHTGEIPDFNKFKYFLAICENDKKSVFLYRESNQKYFTFKTKCVHCGEVKEEDE